LDILNANTAPNKITAKLDRIRQKTSST